MKFNVFIQQSCTKTLIGVTNYVNMGYHLISTWTHNRLSTKHSRLYSKKHTYNRL